MSADGLRYFDYMTTLNKVYEPATVEDRWYSHWTDKKYFHGNPDSEKPPYTIVIPPPNVTGMLTMGHVLNNTIQDILIRKARMNGFEACWIPGTDHASIATEAKVVRMLGDKGINKDDLTREEFLEHAWAWKEKYGGIIIDQLKKLGCSCDWERERFTMDEGYSRAVLEAFVRLYDKGLIYRGQRLVNWCPVSRSAISDEEVLYREVQGHLWYFNYPILDSDESITVATTRPETMLGDTGVAVHPDDVRYKHLIGKKVRLPITERVVPVIADHFVDPEFGTGAVKVTPAHDQNDYNMGKTHGLEILNIMNEDATLNNAVPEEFRGLPREEARKKVVDVLKEEGFLVKTEAYTNKVGYSERGHVPIEYFLSKQWYLKMEDLARPALDAVRSGAIRFHPDYWVKTYFHWMENVRDWCISRQLWWGHRIPVFTCSSCENIMVQIEPPATCSKCKGSSITQDEDVLDTWASSWLWPFAVHSWPESGKDLETFYGTDVLVTGPDIIFFWVARMIIAGTEFMGDLPFRDVYFTSILRDEKGRKFSKSLGNSPDPFDLFEEYGTDAVRFGIMLMAPQGLDVLFSSQRLEVGRNFMNKLWNASRFVHMNLEDGRLPDDLSDTNNLDLPEKWILDKLAFTITKVNRQLDRFHFNEAAKAIYDFTWNDYCDWYIEIAKTRFRSGDPLLAEMARSVAVYVLKKILALLHPYAPFITEELWSYFKRDDEPDLIIGNWPETADLQPDLENREDMGLLQDTITSIRTIRSRMNIPPGKKADLHIRCSKSEERVYENFSSILKTLGRVDNMITGSKIKKPEHSATGVVRGVELFIPLEGLIDLNAEQGRLQKRMDEIRGHLNRLESKLSNEKFIQNAPADVVQNERNKRVDMQDELEKIKTNLEMLS